MVRGEPEHGFERDVPVEAPIVSEDKLVEIGVDVLAAQPMSPPPDADRRRTAPSYYILTNLGQRDEPRMAYALCYRIHACDDETIYHAS